MAENNPQLERPEVSRGGDGLRVRVAWGAAEGLQTYLRHQEVGTTTHLDPTAREAWLEVWPGVDEGRLREALAGWKG